MSYSTQWLHRLTNEESIDWLIVWLFCFAPFVHWLIDWLVEFQVPIQSLRQSTPAPSSSPFPAKSHRPTRRSKPAAGTGNSSWATRCRAKYWPSSDWAESGGKWPRGCAPLAWPSSATTPSSRPPRSPISASNFSRWSKSGRWPITSASTHRSCRKRRTWSIWPCWNSVKRRCMWSM